jgi:hypothetical protein
MNELKMHVHLFNNIERDISNNINSHDRLGKYSKQVRRLRNNCNNEYLLNKKIKMLLIVIYYCCHLHK